jgi:DNA-directed RNA polymerase subunit delta
MIEVAENLMLRKKTPQPFRKIAQEVSELMGLSEAELNSRLARFYADLTLSGKFINVGGDKWDLKNRQKFEVADYQFVFDEDDEVSEVEDIDLEEEGVEEDELDEDDVEEDYEEEYDDGHDEI